MTRRDRRSLLLVDGTAVMVPLALLAALVVAGASAQVPNSCVCPGSSLPAAGTCIPAAASACDKNADTLIWLSELVQACATTGSPCQQSAQCAAFGKALFGAPTPPWIPNQLVSVFQTAAGSAYNFLMQIASNAGMYSEPGLNQVFASLVEQNWTALARTNTLTSATAFPIFAQVGKNLGDALVAKANAMASKTSISYMMTMGRASIMYFAAQWPNPTVPASIAIFQQAMAATKACLAADLARPAKWLQFTYGGNTFDAVIQYPYRSSSTKFPVLLQHGGLDGYIVPLHIVMAQYVLPRNIAVLTFDGPGQGNAIRVNNIAFTPNYDDVLAAVISQLINGQLASSIDNTRVIYQGISLGGFLATKACAANTAKLAACIVNPAALSAAAILNNNVIAGFKIDTLVQALGVSLTPPDFVPQLSTDNGNTVSATGASNALGTTFACSTSAPSVASVFTQTLWNTTATLYRSGLVNSDLLYLCWAFSAPTAAVAANPNSVIANCGASAAAFQKFAVPASSLASITSSVIILDSLQDSSGEGGQAQTFWSALSATTQAKSKWLKYGSSSGAGLHCQIGALQEGVDDAFDAIAQLNSQFTAILMSTAVRSTAIANVVIALAILIDVLLLGGAL